MMTAACPKCLDQNSRSVFVGKDHLHGLPGDFTVVECDTCGLWYLNPRPTPLELSSLYPADYAPHVPPLEYPISDETAGRLAEQMGYAHLARSYRRRRWREMLDRARFRWKAGVALWPHFVPGGSVLDVGAASGSRLLELRKLGWKELHGIELVPAAAARATALGLSVIAGSVEESLDRYADSSFDVVVTNMVLEHLANPFDVVNKIARKLKPGGQFLFSTITRDSLDARLFGDYWCGYDLPRHLVYLRTADIKDMVQERFVTLGTFHHAAPQDFTRPATWRKHEGRMIDRAILEVGRRPAVRNRAALLIAWTRLSCRISYRCQLRD